MEMAIYGRIQGGRDSDFFPPLWNRSWRFASFYPIASSQIHYTAFDNLAEFCIWDRWRIYRIGRCQTTRSISQSSKKSLSPPPWKRKNIATSVTSEWKSKGAACCDSRFRRGTGKRRSGDIRWYMMMFAHIMAGDSPNGLQAAAHNPSFFPYSVGMFLH